jgi:hypothetical protein
MISLPYCGAVFMGCQSLMAIYLLPLLHIGSFNEWGSFSQQECANHSLAPSSSAKFMMPITVPSLFRCLDSPLHSSMNSRPTDAHGADNG